MDKDFDVQRSCKKKPHQYCSRCEYLLTQAHYVFNQDDSSRPIIEHFSTFEQMILGSQEDCHLCSILANYYIALEMDHGTRIFAQLNLDKSSVKCLHARWFRYGSIDGDNRTSPKQFDLSLQVVGTSSVQEGGSESQWCQSNASDDAISLLRSWIAPHTFQQSLANRLKEKRKPRFMLERELEIPTAELPLRVLDIKASVDQNFIKLVDGEMLRRSDYLALSYCWGDSRLPVLTQDNLEQCQHEIAVRDLPSTFRDAIWLTRKLHVQYLWIDALCIMQMGGAEWASESRKMGNIFANSLLTIAAADAENANSGFLKRRNPLATTSCTFAASPNSSITVVIDCSESSVSKSLLDRRGWAYQERLLAPRTAHFTRDRIRLESVDSLRCEIHARQPLSCKILDDPCATRKMNFESHVRKATMEFQKLRGWGRTVADYSETRLTRESDRLPAFAGIATAFAHLAPDLKQGRWQRYSSGYCFGHWVGWMPQELLWRAHIPGKRMVGRAPTWAWPSIEGPRITNDFGLFYRDPYDIVQRVQMVQYPAESDMIGGEAGEDDSFAIEIRAHVLVGELHHDAGQRKSWTIVVAGQAYRPHLYADFDLPLPGGSLGTTRVLCALIASGKRSFERIDLGDLAECLVLKQISGESLLTGCKYERIGCALIHGQASCDYTNLFLQQPLQNLRIY